MSKLFCMPVTTSVNVVDPAPSLAQNPDSPGNLQLGANACAEQCPGSSTAPREVLQEVKMCFQVFVRGHSGAPAHSKHFVLGFAVQDCFALHNAYLSVTQTRSGPSYRSLKRWEVRFDPTDCLRVIASDGGPMFCSPHLADLDIGDSSEITESVSVFDPKRLKLTIDPEDICVRWTFETEGDDIQDYVVLCFTLFVHRRVPKQDWTRLRCKKAPEPKSTLLGLAERTGDIILLGGEGVETEAHSAILVGVPYFEAKLRKEWAGTAAWNMHRKLRLHLPLPAGAETLKLFLQGLYGDLRSLYEVKPESLLLQEVLSLADACGVSGLCADVIQLVEVTSANVDSWLEWLLVDRGADAEPIREQVVQVMRAQLREALQHDPLSVEQLATISRVLPRRTVPQVAS